MDKPPILAGMRVNPELRTIPMRYVPYKDSIVIPCEDCTEEMYLGPEQQKMRATNPEAVILCLDCCAKLVLPETYEVKSLTDKKMGE